MVMVSSSLRLMSSYCLNIAYYKRRLFKKLVSYKN